MDLKQLMDIKSHLDTIGGIAFVIALFASMWAMVSYLGGDEKASKVSTKISFIYWSIFWAIQLIKVL